MKSIIHFLFGKSPDIFDENGQVRHKLPEEKWKKWDARYHDEKHNWRKHRGTATKSRNPKP
ncbi:MAG TPA: hypothetical protein DCL41_03890 [Bdellovibrionales bacterium]|nr:hypothetical protein [Pseudobdellovibrionaceae bacterium]HAG90984.1 hypothetical protein [Bdellovibrionales bacterium]